MHTNTHHHDADAFDSAALWGAQTLFNDCDPMGTCPGDDGETGLLPQELEPSFGEGANASTPPPQEVDPNACDPMGTCPGDDGETGLVGDLHKHKGQ
jgi:hypothetical protein